MATNATESGDESVTAVFRFRLSVKLIERVDLHAKRLDEKTPGVRHSRPMSLKNLLTESLDRAEKKAAGR